MSKLSEIKREADGSEHTCGAECYPFGCGIRTDSEKASDEFDAMIHDNIDLEGVRAAVAAIKAKYPGVECEDLIAAGRNCHLEPLHNGPHQPVLIDELVKTVKDGDAWRNKKNGHLYTIKNANGINATNAQDGQILVTYQRHWSDYNIDESKKWFHREIREFVVKFERVREESALEDNEYRDENGIIRCKSCGNTFAGPGRCEC